VWLGVEKAAFRRRWGVRSGEQEKRRGPSLGLEGD